MSQEKFYGFEFVKESGGIKEYTMTSNGLRVLLKQDNTAPVATFMVTYEVGSRNEAIGYTGSTHLLEHLMFKGSRKFNTKKGNSVFQTLQSLGARMNRLERLKDRVSNAPVSWCAHERNNMA